MLPNHKRNKLNKLFIYGALDFPSCCSGAQNMCSKSISSEYGRRKKAKPCVRTVSAFFPQTLTLQHKRKYG